MTNLQSTKSSDPARSGTKRNSSTFFEKPENGETMVYAPFAIRTGRDERGEEVWRDWRHTNAETRLQGFLWEASQLRESSLRPNPKSVTGYGRAAERVLAIATFVAREHYDSWVAAIEAGRFRQLPDAALRLLRTFRFPCGFDRVRLATEQAVTLAAEDVR